MTKLTDKLLVAMRECDDYNKCRLNYWFREASMRKLAKLGYAEQWLPPSVAERRPRMKRRPWRITDAGRAALAQTENGGERT